MAACENCKAQTDLSLCTDCVGHLSEAFASLAWLWRELETTITRQDKLNLGVIGKAREEPSPINFGAAAIGREVEALLVELVELLVEAGEKFFPALSVGSLFIGPLPWAWKRLPAGYSGDPVQRARWLAHHAAKFAVHTRALDVYRLVTDLTGDPDKPSKKGRLVRAIDRTVRSYAGTCPSLVGRDRDGVSIECGRDLWAEEDMTEVECPKCLQDIDVKRNREKVLMDRDILPEKRLMEVMADLGEAVYCDLLQKWLKAGQLKPSGYLSGSRIVEHRVNKSDARLLSLSRVRQLRWAHQADLVAS